MKRKVQNVWDTNYKPSDSQTEKTTPPRTTNNFFLDLDTNDIAATALTDKYTSYYATPQVLTNNAIRW